MQSLWKVLAKLVRLKSINLDLNKPISKSLSSMKETYQSLGIESLSQVLKFLKLLQSLRLKFYLEKNKDESEISHFWQALETCISMQNLHLDFSQLILHL